jgi:hypothetical protein
MLMEGGVNGKHKAYAPLLPLSNNRNDYSSEVTSFIRINVHLHNCM